MSGREAVMEWPGGPDVLDALKDVATSHRPVSASKVRSTTVWIMRRPLNSLSPTYDDYSRKFLHRYLGHAKQLSPT